MKRFKEHGKRYTKDDNIQSEVGITFNHVDNEEYEKIIYEIVTNRESLEIVFCNEDIDNNRDAALNVFIPSILRSKNTTRSQVEKYIKNLPNNRKYTNIAEVFLPIIFKHIYDYDLIKSVINIGTNIESIEEGADSCLIDKKTGSLVLGEAKFYTNISSAITEMLKSIEKIGTKNSSVHSATDLLSEEDLVIVKRMNENILSDNKTNLISFDEFLKIRKLFAGFILTNDKVKGSHLDKFIDLDIPSFGKITNCIITILPIKSNEDFAIDFIFRAIKEVWHG